MVIAATSSGYAGRGRIPLAGVVSAMPPNCGRRSAPAMLGGCTARQRRRRAILDSWHKRLRPAAAVLAALVPPPASARPEGAHAFGVWALDAGGNRSARTTYAVDERGASPGAYSGDVTLGLTATDIAAHYRLGTDDAEA
jgi:hypothetical protein